MRDFSMEEIVNALDAVAPDWVARFATADDAKDYIRGSATMDDIRRRLIHNVVWTVAHAMLMAERRRLP